MDAKCGQSVPLVLLPWPLPGQGQARGPTGGCYPRALPTHCWLELARSFPLGLTIDTMGIVGTEGTANGVPGLIFLLLI